MSTKSTRFARAAVVSLWGVAMLVGASARAKGGEAYETRPGSPRFLRRFGPAGGWHPDSGGLWHWWNPHCYPRCGGPDDYCRKPPPNVCWPSYPPYYIWAPQSPDGPCPGCVRAPASR